MGAVCICDDDAPREAARVSTRDRERRFRGRDAKAEQTVCSRGGRQEHRDGVEVVDVELEGSEASTEGRLPVRRASRDMSAGQESCK